MSEKEFHIKMKKNPKYSFSNIKLSEDDLLWLNEIYEEQFRKIDGNYLRIKLREKLPRNYDNKKIPYQLVRDNRLTLIGLWLINPNDKYLYVAEKIVLFIREQMEAMPDSEHKYHCTQVAARLNFTEDDVRIAFNLLFDFHLFSGATHSNAIHGFNEVTIQKEFHSIEKILYFNSIYNLMDEEYKQYLETQKKEPKNKQLISIHPESKEIKTWERIEVQYKLSKTAFGKKINFINDTSIRKIIFRDVEDAFLSLNYNLHKSAIVLSGAVIEGILREYLIKHDTKLSDNTFSYYIQKCNEKKLFQPSLSLQLESIKDFRNYIHIEKEIRSQYKVSKPMAQTAVSSIFLIVQGF